MEVQDILDYQQSSNSYLTVDQSNKERKISENTHSTPPVIKGETAQEVTVFRCEDCNQNFNSRQSLEIHTQYHTDNLLTMWRNESIEASPTSNPPPSVEQSLPSNNTENGDLHMYSPINQYPMDSLPLSVEGASDNLIPRSTSIDNSGRVSGLSISQAYPTPSPSFEPNGAFPNTDDRQAGVPSSDHYYPSQSPPTYDFSDPNQPQNMMQRPLANPTSYLSGSSLFNPLEYSLPNNTMVPQQSPGMVNYEDYAVRQISRFHPYGSPVPSPSGGVAIKEEKPSDNLEILDLDAQNMFPSNRTPIPQHSGGPPTHIWNPAETSDQYNGGLMGNGGANVPCNPPNQANQILHINNSMFGGGTVMPQQMHSSMQQHPGFPPSNPPIYHPQGFSPAPIVQSPSPNYLRPTPSPSNQSSQIRQIQNGDAPPTDCPSNVKRPKNFKCELCRKWFTSQGHLKRHYNTALHKSMVKPKEEPAAAESSNSTPPVLGIHPQQNVQVQQTQPPQVLSSEQILPSIPISTAAPAISRLPSMQQATLPSLASSGLRMTAPHQASAALHNPQSIKPENGQLHSQLSLKTAELPPYSSTNSPMLEGFGTVSSSTADISKSNCQLEYRSDYPHHQYSQIALQPNLYSDSHNNYHPLNTQMSQEPVSIYNGQFSTNTYVQSTPSPNSSNGGQFFPLGPTQMTGGGYQNPDTSLVNRVASPPTNSPPVSVYNFVNIPVSQHSDESSNSTDNSRRSKSKSPKGRKSPTTPPVVTRSPPLTNGDTEMKQYECDECPPENKKLFNKMCYLTQHKSNQHEVERKHKCGKCGKRFQDSQTLDDHFQKHGGDKPYKCEECPKSFNHKTDLRRHRCLHTGEKPYACVACGKGFIRKDHMLKHYNTHTKKLSPCNSTAAANRNHGGQGPPGYPPHHPFHGLGGRHVY